MADDTMVKCPQCDRPATAGVVARDGRCSRCTEARRHRKEVIRGIAVRLAEADARSGNLPAPEHVSERAARYVGIAESIVARTEVW